MSGRTWRGLIAGVCAGLLTGCGGEESGVGARSAAGPESSGKRVHLVGFDTCEPLVAALARREIAGIVVQNPFRIGELGVKTLVNHLEKQPVEATVSTGETLVTPDNMNDPEIKPLLSPPRAENVAASLSSVKTKKWRVMVIPKETTRDFWMTIHAGALKAARDLGNVEVVWQGPDKEDDRIQQIQLVQSAVAAGVDGIVLAPLDARALAQPVEMVVAKGIPVVIIDSGLDSSKPVSTISTNNYYGGVLAARRIGQVLGGQGKVILLLYAVGSESTEQREKGFKETLSTEFPGISLLSESEYAGPTLDQAQQKSEGLVTRYRGQFEGVFCSNESSTLGMKRALEAAGLLPANR